MSDYSKKRDLMPKLNAVITACVDMGADVAKLELSDNSKASKRLKRAITDMTEGPLKEFREAVHEARHEIITTPRKKIDGRQFNGAALKQYRDNRDHHENNSDF